MSEEFLNNRTVMFVDDEKNVLNSIRRGLRNEPYKKLFVTSGREALEILENEEVNVIVTDMRMPEMDGLQLLKRVKEKYPDIIRIVLSGYTHISTLLVAINQGDIYRFIPKPWKLEDEFQPVIMSAIQVYGTNEKKYQEWKKLESKVEELKNEINEMNESGGKQAITGKVIENYEAYLLIPLVDNLMKMTDLIYQKLDNTEKRFISYIRPSIEEIELELERLSKFVSFISSGYIKKEEISLEESLKISFFTILKYAEQHKCEVKCVRKPEDEIRFLALDGFVIEEALFRLIQAKVFENVNLIINHENGILSINFIGDFKPDIEMTDTDISSVLKLYLAEFGCRIMERTFTSRIAKAKLIIIFKVNC